MARDQVQLPVEGGPPAANRSVADPAVWQRWNDYGIGLLLEGGNTGGQKGELKQAEQIFLKVAELGPADGWVNLARVYQKEGRIPEALAALEKAANHEKPAAPWVINWLSGQINARNGDLDEAIESFQSVLATKIPDRKFDFSLDYEVNNELGVRSLCPGMRRAGLEPRTARLSQEDDRRLPPHPGHRFRKRRSPSRSGPGLRDASLGREEVGQAAAEATSSDGKHGRARWTPTRS